MINHNLGLCNSGPIHVWCCYSKLIIVVVTGVRFQSPAPDSLSTRIKGVIATVYAQTNRVVHMLSLVGFISTAGWCSYWLERQFSCHWYVRQRHLVHILSKCSYFSTKTHLIWIPSKSVQTISWRFDGEPFFLPNGFGRNSVNYMPAVTTFFLASGKQRVFLT